MNKRMKARAALRTVGLLLVMGAMLLTGCRFAPNRNTPETVVQRVRIYDVEPCDEKEYQYHLHVIRHGMAYSVGDIDMKAPYYDVMDVISYRCGFEIEYVMMGSWEEVREDLGKTRNDGSTKVVLFNNSYDQSILKDIDEGGFMDLFPQMAEAGVYDSEDYQQVVLEAGQFGGRQLLVPLLYNVPGMIGAVKTFTPAQPHYDELIQMIIDKMDTDTDYAQMSVLSTAILDDREPDLFLTAAGKRIEEYDQQEELFNLLYRYVQEYKAKELGANPLQREWAYYIDQNEKTNLCGHFADGLDDYEIPYAGRELLKMEDEDPDIWNAMLSQSAYIAESTSIETHPYHSVMGLLQFGNQINYVGFCDTLTSRAGNKTMGYWPIQTLDQEGYAAQPFCYAAVLDDGDPELAYQVIDALLRQEVGLQCGFTTYRPTWERKLDTWINQGGTFPGFRRNVKYYKEMKTWNEVQWGQTYRTQAFSDRELRLLYGEAVQNELDHIVFAQIMDRQVLDIWQRTLMEATENGLSAEAGFELLCERMDEWWK